MEEYTVEYVAMWKKWNDFKGKANVKDFWMAVLVNFIVGVVLSILASIISILGILGGIYGLVVIIPFIAISVRRLHDTGRSGWYLLWLLLFVIGWVMVILALIKPSE